MPGVLVWTIYDATAQRTVAVAAALRPSMVDGPTAQAVAIDPVPECQLKATKPDCKRP